MKKSKPINFSSTNFFKALYTTIILFLLFFSMLTIFSVTIGNNMKTYALVYILFIIMIYFVERKGLYKQFKSLKEDTKGKLKNIIIVTIILLIIEYVVNQFLLKYVGHGPSNNQTVINNINNYNFIFNLIYFVVLCPALETLIFFYPFKNVNHKKIAFVVSCLLFTFFHISSSVSGSEILFIIPYFIMSVSFYYGFYKTRNIFMSIFTHAINNLIAFVLLFIM